MALQTKDPSTAVISSVGAVLSGGTTSSTKPVITGTADAGNIVVIYDGIRPLGSVVVAANGTWSFTPTADIKAGAHSFAAIAHDTAGNFGASSAVVSVTVTPVPTEPAAVITGMKDDLGNVIGAGAATSNAKPTLSGTGVAGDVVKLYDGSGTTVLGSATVDASGKWSIIPNSNLTVAAHDFYVTQTNPAGTVSPQSNHFAFIYATVPVAATIESVMDVTGLHPGNIPSGGTSDDARPVVSGTGRYGELVYLYDGASTVIGSAAVDSTGHWSITPSQDLASGQHDLIAKSKTMTTVSWGTNSATWTVMIDATVPTAPAVPVLTDDSGLPITAGSTTNDNHPHISGTGTAGDIIKVYDGASVIGSVKIGSDGKWTFTPTTDLSNAAHTITVTDTNAAGTEGPHSNGISFTVDSTLPNAPVITAMNDYRMDNGAFITAVPLGGTVTSANVAFGGTATANGVVYVYDGATLIASVKADASGAWFYASKTYTSGLHDMSATQKSPAGVETAHSNHWTFTVNAVIPATPTVPVITNDAGATIPAGGTTNDAHPHIAGTGTAGDIITVYDNGTVIGSTTVAGNGTWSFTPATDLPSGTNAITVIETNASGNASAVSPAINVVVDTSVPAKPAVPVLTDDSGASIPAGSTTNDGHPNISGTGTAGDIITVYDGSTVLGSVKIGSDGKWSFTPSSDLSTGSHNISVTDTNAAGTMGPKSDAIAFKLVEPAPVITNVVDSVGTIMGAVVDGGVTDDARPTISGTGVPGDRVYIYQNGVGCGDTYVDATGHWTVRLPNAMADGLHVMTATQFASGNSQSAASNSWTITVNTSTPAKPAVPVLTDDSGASIPAGSTTADVHPHISGTGTAGDIITVYDGANVIGSVKIDGTGHWTFTPSSDLSAGNHDLKVVETNLAGTSSPASDSIHVVIGSAPATPTAPVLTDDSGAAISSSVPTADATPHISGTGTAGDTITVYDGNTALGTALVDSNGKWTFTPSTDLAGGSHSITVTEGNASGTSAHSPAVAFTFNPAAPDAPLLTSLVDAAGPNAGNVASGGIATDGHPTLSGTGHANDTITVYDGSKVLGTTTVGSNGTWSFTPATALSYGAHSLNATETNAAGLTSVASAPYPFYNAGIVITSITDSNGNAVDNGGTALGTMTITGWLDPSMGATVSSMALYMSGGSIGRSGDPKIMSNGPVFTVNGDTFTLVLSKQAFSGLAGDSGTLGAGTYTIDVRANSAMTMTIPGTTWTITDSFTAPSAPQAPTLTDGSSMAIPAGSTTTDGHPHINGTGTAGDTITVYDGNTALGTALVDSNGKWTFTPSTDLAGGSHSITVTEGNASGTSAHSPAVAFTFNPAAPDAPLLTSLVDAAGPNAGNVASGGIATDGHPTLSGTGHANDTITVYDGSKVLGTTTVGSNGTWSFTPATALSYGAHSLNATETNAVGLTSVASAPYPFYNAGIVITSITDSNGNAVDNGGTALGTMTITGWLDPSMGATASSMVLYMSGGSITGGKANMSNGPVFTVNGDTFTLVLSKQAFSGAAGDSGTLSAGTYTIDVRADSAMTTTIPGMTWTITDSFAAPSAPQAPTLTDDSSMAIPAGSTTTDGHPHINGTGTAGDTITVYDGNTALGTALVDSNGKWKFTPSTDLAGGSHSITVTEGNASGTSAHSDATAVTVLSEPAEIVRSSHSETAPINDSEASSTQHTIVGEHDTFVGTPGISHTVDLSVDPASYFKDGASHIQGGGSGGIDTLHLLGSNEVLDLSSLTGKTAAAKISGIEVFDLGGHANTLKLSLTDVLNLGEEDLFQHDGHQQLMVNGSNGDSVDLSNSHIAGVADGQWQQEGTAQVGGVIYNVYEHSGAHTELLIQQGVQITLHS